MPNPSPNEHTSGPDLVEDITLYAREGEIALSGQLQSYDGEFYRLLSRFGAVTVDAEGVVCEGPACPELIAPRAQIRLIGETDLGEKLALPLFERFAQTRGLSFTHQPLPHGGWQAQIANNAQATILADITFASLAPADAAAVMRSGEAEFQLSTHAPRGPNTQPIAFDALLPVMAAENPTPVLSTVTLAAALSGKATNWNDLGGPDMPVVIHGLGADADFAQALKARLGFELAVGAEHSSLASLAQGVAADPWGLALTGRAEHAPATPAPLTDSCGFPLSPTPMAVKAGDYPLALPIYLEPSLRRLPLIAREFQTFLTSPEAQGVIARAGYIDLGVERAPMTADGSRLLNAIRGAGTDVSLDALKELADVMEGAERLSLTFRFDEGTSVLDAVSQENLAQLAQLIGAEQFQHHKLILAGFSDSTGDGAANKALSLERARRVADDLARHAPDLGPEALPVVMGFGEALPMACDTTVIGRRLNRRVELWLKPDFSPAPTAEAAAPP